MAITVLGAFFQKCKQFRINITNVSCFRKKICSDIRNDFRKLVFEYLNAAIPTTYLGTQLLFRVATITTRLSVWPKNRNILSPRCQKAKQRATIFWLSR